MNYYFWDRDINISFATKTGERLTGKLRAVSGFTGACIVEADDGRILSCQYVTIKRLGK